MEKQNNAQRFSQESFDALAMSLHVPREECRDTDHVNCKFASTGDCLTHARRRSRKSPIIPATVGKPRHFVYAPLPTIPEHEKVGTFNMKHMTHIGFHNTLANKLSSMDITKDSIAWFEFEHGRRYAPWPVSKLRHAARKAGFHSSAQFLAAEKRSAA